MKNDEIQSLSVTSEYFKILIAQIHLVFKKKHGLKKIPKTYQLYGYGDYDDSKPSIKADLEAIGTEFINGKYLYDKLRQVHKGRPVIKLSKYYRSIVLLYLGHPNFKSFIDAHPLGKNENENQLSLLYNQNEDQTFYYVSYYFGEDNKLLKGQTIISEKFKKIQHIYVYPQEDGSYKTHYSYGTIVRREDTLHIKTKTLLDGKLVEGGSEIYYIGHNDPTNTNYLVGTYCTFDIYTQTVAGKSIFEKYDSKEEMEESSKNKTIPPYIALELRNNRIVNKSLVPKHYHELSENSPYASIYARIPGNYTFTFTFDDGTDQILNFEVKQTNYQITPITKEVYIEKDDFQLLNRGSILRFSFKFAGLIMLDRVDIYVKTYFLSDPDTNQPGVFSGIDHENRPVSGQVVIAKKA